MPLIKLELCDTTKILVQEINQDLFDFQSTLHFRQTHDNLNKSHGNLNKLYLTSALKLVLNL